MNTIKQFGKGDNAHQSPLDIAQFLKNSISIDVINIFDVDLHHGPIGLKVEEGLDTKNDGFITSKGRYSKLMGR
jgi:hypothetical protein